MAYARTRRAVHPVHGDDAERTATTPERLEDLPNIGRVLATRLRAVGIGTPEELMTIGAVSAYRHLASTEPGAPLSFSRYLYPLDAAIMDIRKEQMPESRKQWLRSQISLAP